MKVIIQVKQVEPSAGCYGCIFDGYGDSPCCTVGDDAECDNDSIYKVVEVSDVIGVDGNSYG